MNKHKFSKKTIISTNNYKIKGKSKRKRKEIYHHTGRQIHLSNDTGLERRRLKFTPAAVSIRPKSDQINTGRRLNSAKIRSESDLDWIKILRGKWELTPRVRPPSALASFSLLSFCLLSLVSLSSAIFFFFSRRA